MATIDLAAATAQSESILHRKVAELTEVSDDENSQSTVDPLDLAEDQAATADPADVDSWELAQAPAISAFLEPFGYYVEGGYTSEGLRWQEGSLPVAFLRVNLHTEQNGHTVYMVECSVKTLLSEEPHMSWSTTQRLRDLRKNFNDYLKKALGAQYNRHFKATPFAHRLGPPGTTARLHAWFQSLAACMTAGLLRPGILAQVLKSLRAPQKQLPLPKVTSWMDPLTPLSTSPLTPTSSLSGLSVSRCLSQEACLSQDAQDDQDDEDGI